MNGLLAVYQLVNDMDDIRSGRNFTVDGKHVAMVEMYQA